MDSSKYEEIGLVGSGTFGSVFAARELSNQNIVALKKIPKAFFPNCAMELIHHLEATSKLENITKVLDSYETPDTFTIVMEYYEQNLAQYIYSKGKLDEGEAKTLFKQIVFAVEKLNKIGLNHGDLKCENIMVSADKTQIFITDFGSASLKHDEMCEAIDFLGTNAPPEYYVLQKYYQTDAEMWSLGFILYVMVCGTPPFTCYHEIMIGYYEINVTVSMDCKRTIIRLLANNPVLRVQTIEHLINMDFLKS